MVTVIDGTFYNYKGYEGTYEFSKEDNVYWGKISNTDDLVLFEGNDLSELYQSFKDAVNDYINLKKEIGKEQWLEYEFDEVIVVADLDLTWMFEAIDKHYEKEHAIIKASNKASLTKDQLLNVLFEDGVLAIYNLGMKHMYEYLKEQNT